MTRSRALKVYVALIGSLTVGVLGYAAELTWITPHHTVLTLLPAAALFVGLGLLSSRQQVYFTQSNTIALGAIVQMATIILFPYPMAILIIGLAKSLSELSFIIPKRRNRRWMHVIVNIGGAVLANAVGGAIFLLMGGHVYLWSKDAEVLIAVAALACMAALYYVTDVLVVTIAISLSSRDRPWTIFSNISRGTMLPEMSLILVGIVFAVIVHFSAVLSLFILVPVIFSLRAFEAVARLRRETVEAVLKMAESIDYRDTGTYEHSQRLSDLTRRLAEAVSLMPEHVEQVVLASKVHDLGKIGITNDILFKQGPLTSEERHVMQDHPVIGASILSSYSAFRSSVEIVRHHHERWDGSGYPDGLKGEAIPVGSRIITVVDSFDAMTADRVYRDGVSVVEAVERLKAGMGSQFDPKICAAFIQMLIEDGTYVPHETAGLHIVSRKAVS